MKNVFAFIAKSCQVNLKPLQSWRGTINTFAVLHSLLFPGWVIDKRPIWPFQFELRGPKCCFRCCCAGLHPLPILLIQGNVRHRGIDYLSVRMNSGSKSPLVWGLVLSGITSILYIFTFNKFYCHRCKHKNTSPLSTFSLGSIYNIKETKECQCSAVKRRNSTTQSLSPAPRHRHADLHREVCASQEATVGCPWESCLRLCDPRQGLVS